MADYWPKCRDHLVIDTDFLRATLDDSLRRWDRASKPPDGWVMVTDTEAVQWSAAQWTFAKERLIRPASGDFDIAYLQDCDYQAVKAMAAPVGAKQ